MLKHVKLKRIENVVLKMLLSEQAKAQFEINVVRCVIWYHLRNLKNVKNTHGGVLLLVKLQVSACNITKSNIPP